MSLSRADRVRLPFLVDFFELWYRSLDEREEKRRTLHELLKQSERSSDAKAREEAVVGLDHLSETGSAEEKALAKVTLAQDLAELGEAEIAAGYIVELKRLELEGLGGWVAGHALEWQQQVPNVYADLAAMIDCWQTQRSGDLEAFAKALLKMGQDLSAKSFSEARVEFLTESLKHVPKPEQRIKIRLRLASTLRALARWDDAETHLIAAKAEAEASNDSKLMSDALNELGVLCYDLARYDEAEPLIRGALDIAENAYGPEHQEVATRLGNLAEVLQKTTRTDEAEPLMRRALEIAEKAHGPEHPHVIGCLTHLANVLVVTGRADEAEALVHRTLRITEEAYGPEHPFVAACLLNLSLLLKHTNRTNEAEPLMRRTLEVWENSFGPGHPRTVTARKNLERLLSKRNG